MYRKCSLLFPPRLLITLVQVVRGNRKEEGPSPTSKTVYVCRRKIVPKIGLHTSICIYIQKRFSENRYSVNLNGGRNIKQINLICTHLLNLSYSIRPC